MTRSPGWIRCAAAPLMPTMPESRGPSIRYVRQPVAVGDVDDVDLLTGQQVRRLHQGRVERAGPDVVQVRLGDGGPVHLGLHHLAQHGAIIRAPRSLSVAAVTFPPGPAQRQLSSAVAQLRLGLGSGTAGADCRRSFSPSMSTLGRRRLSQRGSHQADLPRRAMTAGTMVIRTMKASTGRRRPGRSRSRGPGFAGQDEAGEDGDHDDRGGRDHPRAVAEAFDDGADRTWRRGRVAHASG